ncbi:hypothetical protein [Ruegeria sp. B32]|uniref:hypothetical protein n=1 Tax=Ruegeria sp. B32 TaxID=2867020 RepID=UPI003904CB8D
MATTGSKYPDARFPRWKVNSFLAHKGVTFRPAASIELQVALPDAKVVIGTQLKESGSHLMTTTRLFPTLSLLAVVAGCATTGAVSGDDESGTLTTLPDSVVAMAAPSQDLSAVRLMPEDGCYWYRHVGPVEITYLPLRTTEGRPICTRVQ